MLSIPGGLNVTDTRYDKVDFVDQQVKVDDRNIEAAVDKAGGRKVENIFGGSVSDGDLLIYTSAKLYISDEYDPGDPNDKQMQTFFSFHGFEYRVAGVDWWSQQLGMKVYLAKRHLQQELSTGSAQAPLQGDF